MAKSSQHKPKINAQPDQTEIDQEIESVLDEAKQEQDLLPLLRIIKFNNVKSFIKSEISQQSKQEQYRNRLKILSMNYILNDEEITIILSFLQSIPQRNHIKLVSKLWNKLSKKAEAIYFEYIHKQTENIWICSSKRTNTKKNEVEKSLKIKGIRNNLKTIIDSDSFKDGDFILLHPGSLEMDLIDEECYDPKECSSTRPLLQITNDCTIFGIPQTNKQPIKLHGTIQGEYAIHDELEISFIEIGSRTGKPCTVNIQNLHFIPNNLITSIYVNSGSTLMISNCIFTACCHGIQHYGHNLIVNNSKIKVDGSAIMIGYHSKSALIQGNTLINSCIDYESCIKFVQHEGSHDNKQFVKTQIQNNRLVSNQYPVIIDHHGDQHKYSSKVILTTSNNKWYEFWDCDPNGVSWSHDNKDTWKIKGKVKNEIHVLEHE